MKGNCLRDQLIIIVDQFAKDNWWGPITQFSHKILSSNLLSSLDCSITKISTPQYFNTKKKNYCILLKLVYLAMKCKITFEVNAEMYRIKKQRCWSWIN